VLFQQLDALGLAGACRFAYAPGRHGFEPMS
jgi:hypothetical protein